MGARLCAFAKASTFGGGGILRSKMTEGVRPRQMLLAVANPFSLASLDSFPEGDALGKGGEFVGYGQLLYPVGL